VSPDAVFVVAFWVLIAVWPLVYLGYPVTLLAIARWRGVRPMEVDLPWPTVAILVAAHNEEETIERCVRSCLAQRYPGDPLAVVVGLDGCTDGTAEVLRRIEDPRLRVVAFERQGKAATDNALIAGCDTDVVATTSAGAEYSPGALAALVRPFRSSRVGCVGGVFAPRRTEESSAAAEARYFALEYRLMRAESDLGILAKASGTALTFRRSLWRPIPVTSDADISLPCLIAAQGRLVLFAPDAVVLDDGPRDLKAVFRARRRMATQALANVPRHAFDLARAGYWGHAASIAFHKLLRWLAPLAAIACAIDALVLGALGHWGYASLLVATAFGALLALSAVSVLRGNRLSVVASFVVSQLAFIAGTADCVRGSRMTRWDR
jgi:cellulose synthase/poly-beta-1,6-N-acetylglucosamine synthase-like glycosyltransferase